MSWGTPTDGVCMHGLQMQVPDVPSRMGQTPSKQDEGRGPCMISLGPLLALGSPCTRCLGLGVSGGPWTGARRSPPVCRGEKHLQRTLLSPGAKDNFLSALKGRAWPVKPGHLAWSTDILEDVGAWTAALLLSGNRAASLFRRSDPEFKGLHTGSSLALNLLLDAYDVAVFLDDHGDFIRIRSRLWGQTKQKPRGSSSPESCFHPFVLDLQTPTLQWSSLQHHLKWRIIRPFRKRSMLLL